VINHGAMTLNQGGESSFITAMTESQKKIPVAYGSRGSLRRQVLEMPYHAADRFTGHCKAPRGYKVFPLRMPDSLLLAKTFSADLGFVFQLDWNEMHFSRSCLEASCFRRILVNDSFHLNVLVNSRIGVDASAPLRPPNHA
jgi:hypothetical protein